VPGPNYPELARGIRPEVVIRRLAVL
jgi:hypothetical protein